jgi:hypothetical protein
MADGNRWDPFTWDELKVLYDGLTEYDGTFYEPERDDQPTYRLVKQMEFEAYIRGHELPST